MNIYPNPASSYLNIDVSGNLEYHVQIINVNGQVIQTLSQPKLVDLRNLNSGMYILKISDANSSSHILERIVVAR